VDQSI